MKMDSLGLKMKFGTALEQCPGKAVLSSLTIPVHFFFNSRTLMT